MIVESPYILVVDDDTRLRALLRKYLSENGFRVATAGDAAAARAKMKSIAFDLIVLDVMMPGEDGLELTRSLRLDNSVPILLITAMDEPADRVVGLESGADDYLAKPFEPRELLLRMRTILRRAPPPRAKTEAIGLGACRFDPARAELFRGDKKIRLTEAEARLLKALAERPGTALTRQELSNAGGIRANERTVDVHVTRLRRKIESDPKSPRYLRTVRGKGYALWPD